MLDDTETEIDGAPAETFAVFDASGVLVDCSESFAGLVGKTSEELINTCAADVAAGLSGRSAKGRTPVECFPLDFVLDGPDGCEYSVRHLRGANSSVVVLFTERTESEPTPGNPVSLLDDAVEAMPSGFALFSAEFCLQSCNSAYEAYTGVSRDTLIGMRGEEVIAVALKQVRQVNGVLVENPAEIIDQVISDFQVPAPVAFLTESKDGKWHTVSHRKIATGGFVTIINEITEQKELEREVDRRRALLQEAVDSIPEFFALFDSDGKVAACNTAYAEFHGLARDGLIGISYDDEMRLSAMLMSKTVETMNGKPFPSDAKSAYETLSAVRSQENSRREVLTRDGQYVVAQDFPTKTGGNVLIGRDVTPERQAAIRLEDAIEAIPDRVAIDDGNGVIVACNSAFADFLEVPRDEVIGAEGAWALRLSLEKYANINGEPIESFEALEQIARDAAGTEGPLRLTTKDENVYLADYRKMRLGGHVFVARDVTELRQATQRLEDAIEAMPASFGLYDSEHRLVACNASYQAYHGRSSAELLGDKAEKISDRFMSRAKSFNGIPVETFKGGERLRDQVIEDPNHSGVIIEMQDGTWMLQQFRPIREGGYVTVALDITQQHHASQLLKDAIEVMPASFGIYDPNDRLVACNSGYEHYMGQTADKLLGLNAQETGELFFDRAKTIAGVPVADFTEGVEMRQQLLDDPDQKGVVVEMKSGEWFLQQFRRISEGGYVTVALDITKQQLAARRLEDAVEAMPGPFGLFDAEGRLEVCNAAFEKQRGRSREEITGWKNADLAREMLPKIRKIDGVALGENLEPWLERIKESEKSPEERPHLVELKQDSWYLMNHVSISTGGFVSTWSDITEQKHLEQEVQRSEAQLREMVEHYPMPISVMRMSDAGCLFASPAAEAALGVGSGELLGEPAMEFFTTSDFPKFEEARSQMLEQGQITAFEMTIRRKNGETFPALVSGQAIEYRGEPAGIISFMDLTAQKEMEATLRGQREALFQSEKLNALGTLLAGVAHELNNPLTVVAGQALLLGETAPDEATRSRAAKIGSAADRCTKIVKTFLAMARQKPPVLGPVNLKTVIDDALEITGYSLRQVDIEIDLLIPPNLPAIWADPDQLGQVLVNLIVNAHQALESVPVPRKLAIIAKRRPGERSVEVRIEDNGTGIPEEARARIFEPFYTTKEVGAGTGLGLSLTSGIIESHGGRIRIGNTPLGGAALVLTLPESKQPDVADGPGAAEKSSPGFRILVVDDEVDIVDMIRDVLKLDGHTIFTASSGIEALAILEDQQVDLIFSDMRMPGMDGPQLYEHLRKKYPGLVDRTAFITGDTLSESVMSFLQGTPCRSLEKPVSPSELRDLVAELTASQS